MSSVTSKDLLATTVAIEAIPSQIADKEIKILKLFCKNRSTAVWQKAILFLQFLPKK